MSAVERLQEAVSAVKSNILTYRDAAKKYNIASTVIFNRINGRHNSLTSFGQGRKPTLGQDIEAKLEEILIERAKICDPCDKTEMKELVGEFIKIRKLETAFNNDIPGEKWYRNFMQRHPRLTFKKPEHLQRLRKDARKPEIVYDFFEKIEKLAAEKKLNDKPQFVFNADESGFASDPKKLKAIGVKGVPLCRASGGSGRESTSVLACCSANGEKLPPLIIFKACAVQGGWLPLQEFPGTLYATSDNGWMEEPVFYNWFSKGFIPYVKDLRTKLKLPNQCAMLYFDGHVSHISLRTVEIAMENNIELVKFPSHLTDRIQPLDLAVFGPVKTAWSKKLIKFGNEQRKKKLCGRLNRAQFSQLLGEIWTESIRAKNCVSGFLNSGLFPVDRKKFPVELFEPAELEYWEEKLKGKNSNVSMDQNKEDSQVSADVNGDSNTSTVENGIINSSQNNNLNKNSENTRNCGDLDANRSSNLPTAAANVISQPSTSTNDQEEDMPDIYISNRINETIENYLKNNLGRIFEESLTSVIKTMRSGTVQQKDMSNEELLKSLFGVGNNAPSSDQEPKNTPKNIRLKQLAYGEVLTTEEVKTRLQEAQEKKNNKKPKNNTASKPQKNTALKGSSLNDENGGKDKENNKMGDIQTENNEMEKRPNENGKVKKGVPNQRKRKASKKSEDPDINFVLENDGIQNDDLINLESNDEIERENVVPTKRKRKPKKFDDENNEMEKRPNENGKVKKEIPNQRKRKASKKSEDPDINFVLENDGIENDNLLNLENNDEIEKENVVPSKRKRKPKKFDDDDYDF